MLTEASGCPECCQNENDRWSYIRDYHEKEGILLNYINIKKNPGLRALAKLMLNRNNNLLFIFTGNTGMYSPLDGRILHLMSPSYCCISVKPSVTISGCPMGIFPVSTLKSGNASSTEKFEKTTIYEPVSTNLR
jgi:hypothetical protein